MIVLDASVVIGFLDRGDAHHQRAFDLLMLTDDYRMHTMTMAEVLVRGARRGDLIPLQERLSALGVVEVDRHPREAAELARLRVQTGLKLPDCCVLIAAEVTGAGVATFDDRLADAARRRGIEVRTHADRDD